MEFPPISQITGISIISLLTGCKQLISLIDNLGTQRVKSEQHERAKRFMKSTKKCKQAYRSLQNLQLQSLNITREIVKLFTINIQSLELPSIGVILLQLEIQGKV